FGDYAFYSWCEEVDREPVLMYHPGVLTNNITLEDPNGGPPRVWLEAPAGIRITPPYRGKYRENAYAGVRFAAPADGLYEFRVRVHSLPQFSGNGILQGDFLTVQDQRIIQTHYLSPTEHLSLTNRLSLSAKSAVEFLCSAISGKDRLPPILELDIEVDRR